MSKQQQEVMKARQAIIQLIAQKKKLAEKK
jgi:hypothetical protein